VRSGAPVSMPGMLETVLNVGMCDVAARGMVALTGNPRLAWDSYRRLVESYGAVVHALPHEPFTRALQDRLDQEGAHSARELPARTLEELTRDHLDRFAQMTGAAFPQDPREQLVEAAGAVIRSWDGAKAREYRRLNAIPDEVATGVILQRMVFGNGGGLSGAGVGFTRDPALGERRLYMDFLFGAQGEDVVAGRRTAEGAGDLAALAPEVLAEIERACPRLESEFGDAQEFELTLQDGELFLLQARTAKRTPWAALQIAVDQVQEGLISEEDALQRLDSVDLDQIRRVRVDASGAATPLARAIPASVGVATGPIALDGEAATRAAAEGTPPVLVRAHTATEDIAAIEASAGLLTGAGGRTSHAAVVARELGKPCLVGCPDLRLHLAARTVSIGGRTLAEGDVICLDAESGLVYAGAPRVVEERPEEQLAAVTAWRAGQPVASGGQ
jgi:pyruvate, orthophosphate dikinase